MAASEKEASRVTVWSEIFVKNLLFFVQKSWFFGNIKYLTKKL